MSICAVSWLFYDAFDYALLCCAIPLPLLALENTHALQWVHVDFAQLMRLCTCLFRAKRKPFEKHVIPVRLLFSQFDIKISHFALVEFIVSIRYVLHLIGKVQYMSMRTKTTSSAHWNSMLAVSMQWTHNIPSVHRLRARAQFNCCSYLWYSGLSKDWRGSHLTRPSVL